MAGNMYKQFKTDQNKEERGVLLEYEDFNVRVIRPGPSNKKYARVLESETRPYRRAIQTDAITTEQMQGILRRVYAKSVIVGWETKVDGLMKSGIEGSDGELLPFTQENVIATFEALPDLFVDIVDRAGKQSLWREDEIEADSGNS